MTRLPRSARHLEELHLTALRADVRLKHPRRTCHSRDEQRLRPTQTDPADRANLLGAGRDLGRRRDRRRGSDRGRGRQPNLLVAEWADRVRREEYGSAPGADALRHWQARRPAPRKSVPSVSTPFLFGRPQPWGVPSADLVRPSGDAPCDGEGDQLATPG